MKIIRRLSLILGVLASSSLAHAGVTRFVAMGDVPYQASDVARFEGLIDEVNRIAPDFAVHVGDTKGGGAPCTDAALTAIPAMFDRFQMPLIYTPGDNEWTDCHRQSAGGYDPLERLAFLRKSVFARPTSFGTPAMALEHQSSVAGYEPFVENSMWSLDRVIYATIHVVGSNNNRDEARPSALAEYAERNAANLAWVDMAFAQAAESDAAAVVLFMQADPGFYEKPEQRTGYGDLLARFGLWSEVFEKPVLLVHGDTHVLIMDQPLRKDGETLVENFMRLEVPGAPFVQGVLVGVDSGSSQPFSFRPLRRH